MAAAGIKPGARAVAPIPATTERRLGENRIAFPRFVAPPKARRIVLVANLLLIEPKMKPGARWCFTFRVGFPWTLPNGLHGLGRGLCFRLR
jgi:hypothetical protein